MGSISSLTGADPYVGLNPLAGNQEPSEVNDVSGRPESGLGNGVESSREIGSGNEPQLGEPPQDENALGEQGVNALKDVMGEQPVEAPIEVEDAQEPQAEPQTVTVPKNVFDLRDTQGLCTFVEKSLDGFRTRLANYLPLDTKIAHLKAEMAAMHDDDVRKTMLENQITELQRIADDYKANVDNLTRHLAWKHTEMTPDAQRAETDSQRETRLMAEFERTRTALRNFRYDFSRLVNPKEGFFAALKRGLTLVGLKLGRNRGDMNLHTAEIESVRTSSKQFYDLYNDVLERFGLSDSESAPADFSSFDDIEDFMGSVDRMMKEKSSESVTNMCMRSMKEQLRTLAQNGGVKVFEVSLGLSVGCTVTDSVDVSVGGKGKYVYKVSSAGDGTVTVEKVGAGGLTAGAKFRVGDILQAKVGAEGTIGVGKAHTYRDLDSAVLKMGKWSRFNPVFIKGRSIGTNIKFALKYLGAGLLALPKLALKGIDALHNAIHGNHLLNMFDPLKQYSDKAFLKSLQDRNILDKADRLLRPRKNVLVMGKRTFLRGASGVSGGVLASLGPAHLKLDNQLVGQRDFNARKTQFRTYMSYLCTDQKGYVKASYKSAHDIAEVHTIDDPVVTNELLDRTVSTAEEKQQLASEITREIETMIEREDKLAADVEELLEEKRHPDFTFIAAEYRMGMLALAALLERFDGIAGALDDATRQAFGALREKAMECLENPGVEFPKEAFENAFFVQTQSDDDRIVIKHEHFFEFDPLAGLKGNMLQGTGLAAAGTGMSLGTVGKMAARAGAMGAVGGAEKALGVMGHVGVTVTYETPLETSTRPWRNLAKKTITLQCSQNMTYDLIMRHCTKALMREAKLPEPTDAQWDWKDMLSNAAIGGAVEALKQGFYDALATFQGISPDAALGDRMASFTEGGVLDTWQSGRTVQFEFLGDRLSAVSLGNGEKLKVDIGVPLGGPLNLKGGIKFEQQVNTNSYWNHPSMDALLAKCEAHLHVGNRTAWKWFALHNDAGFMRMAQIVLRNVDRNGKDLQPADPEDDNARADAMRFREELKRIDADIDKAMRDGNGELSVRLVRNRAALYAALMALHDLADDPDTIDLDKVIVMREILECVVQHYDLLDDNAAKIEQLKSGYGDTTHVQVESVDIAEDSKDWEMLHFDNV